MSPMRHYLYYKSDIILAKPTANLSVCQQSVLKVTSSVIVARSGAFGWHNIFV